MVVGAGAVPVGVVGWPVGSGTGTVMKTPLEEDECELGTSSSSSGQGGRTYPGGPEGLAPEPPPPGAGMTVGLGAVEGAVGGLETAGGATGEEGAAPEPPPGAAEGALPPGAPPPGAPEPPPGAAPEPPPGAGAAGAEAPQLPEGGAWAPPLSLTSGPGSGYLTDDISTVVQPLPMLARKMPGREEKEARGLTMASRRLAPPPPMVTGAQF